MKDLKESLKEQLEINESNGKLTASKTAKFTQGNTEVVALDIPSGKKTYVMYDNDTNEADIICTDNIADYLEQFGVPESESGWIQNLDIAESWWSKNHTQWTRIK